MDWFFSDLSMNTSSLLLILEEDYGYEIENLYEWLLLSKMVWAGNWNP